MTLVVVCSVVIWIVGVTEGTTGRMGVAMVVLVLEVFVEMILFQSIRPGVGGLTFS